MGDNVNFNAATKTFSENTANPTPAHSPIVGWVRDGYPMYGPYGYSVANNPGSGVRRMISGFVRRDGQNGTQNLSVTGRVALPQWAIRFQGNTLQTLDPSQYSPPISGTRPLGRYIEDNDYLGDLIKPATGAPYVQGVDFDLDEFNGRFCVTPEFPGGTYAYFVSINADGSPKFPYYLGRLYYARPLGGVVTSIAEPVTVHFSGGPKTPLSANVTSVNQASGDVTLTWSAVDGGTYQVSASPELSNWTPIHTSPPAAQTSIPTPEPMRALVEPGAALPGTPRRFYRVERTTLAPFDSTGFAP
jgi:hypothetical protein